MLELFFEFDQALDLEVIRQHAGDKFTGQKRSAPL
jgi:hypothetical protein